jgi:60 kDa SS-A/Ro ribonucleoprotein
MWFPAISADPGIANQKLEVRVGRNEFIRTNSYMRTESDNWTRLRRFLTLGSEAGTYYVRERPLTVENAVSTIECLKTDGLRLVRTVVEISTAGRAPRNAPALFTLALASSRNFADAETIGAALEALPEVARTGSDLCSFAAFVENLRGWGRSLRSAVADWYLRKPAAELACQMLTHQYSNGWSHRDLLRLSHPKAVTSAHNALFQWAVDGELGHLASREILSGDLCQVHAFELAKKSASEDEIVNLIEENRLTHEMIASEWKSSARVWEAAAGKTHRRGFTTAAESCHGVGGSAADRS